MPDPSILTTTVGSYPVPDWLAALPERTGVARRHARRLRHPAAGRHRSADRRRALPLRRQSSRHQRHDRVLHPPDGRHASRSRPQRHEDFRRKQRWGSGASRRAWSKGRSAKARSTCSPIASCAARCRRRSVQVHRHQPVHARAHAARPPLPRLRALTLAIADVLATQVAECRRRACRWTRPTSPATPTMARWPPTHQSRARRGDGGEGRAFLLRQLWRPDAFRRATGER